MHEEMQQKESQSSQKSLKIGAPESTHEKEAGENAKQFVSGGMLNHTQNSQGMLSHAGSAQSKSHEGEATTSTRPGVKEQLENSKGLGEALTGSMQRKVKQQYGGDWKDVRIHTDGRAFDLCADLEANAFAYGKDVYFAPGKYDAHTLEGKELLGHELAHVAQQKEWSEPVVQRSAVVNMVNGAPVVKAHIYFYGGEAKEAVAKAATDEINTMWNEPKGQVEVGAKNQTVTFDVKYSVVDEDTAHAKANGNTDRTNNFVRIEKDKNRWRGAVSDRSWMDISENQGHWLTKDSLGASTTAAHEFGHGLGLVHTSYDMRGKGQPGIMAGRGTLVDADYTYSPDLGDSWQEYDAGKDEIVGKNTVKPEKRKVTQKDIDHLNRKKAIDMWGNITLGNTTNKMLNIMGDYIANKNSK